MADLVRGMFVVKDELTYNRPTRLVTDDGDDDEIRLGIAFL